MDNLSLWNNIITSPEYSALGPDDRGKLRSRFVEQYGKVPDDTAIPLWKEVVASPEYKQLSANDKTLLQTRFAEKYQPAPQPKGILYAAKSGFEHSATGLALRAASGSRTMPENYAPQGWEETAASTAAGLGSDIWLMAGGAVAGTVAGTAAGLESGPGAAITAGLGAGAGTFAAPAIVAEASTQIIKYGEIKDYGKLAEVAIEQGGIGALTNFIGGKVLERILTPEARALYQSAVKTGDKKAIVNILDQSGATRKIAQKVLPAAAEVATFTTGEAAKEGRLPTSQELATNAAAILGLHIAGAVAGKILPSGPGNAGILDNIKKSAGDADLEALKNNPNLLKKYNVTSADIETIQKERASKSILNATSVDEAIDGFNKATAPPGKTEVTNDSQTQGRVVPVLKQQEERQAQTPGWSLSNQTPIAGTSTPSRVLFEQIASDLLKTKQSAKESIAAWRAKQEQLSQERARNLESLQENKAPGPVAQEISKLKTQTFRTDAQRRAERIADAREAFQNLTPENIKSVLPVMEKQLSEGETGYRYKEPSSSNFDGGVVEGKYNGVKSTNPDWIKLKTLQEYDKRNGTKVSYTLNKNSFKRILSKVKDGQKLTSAQEDAWDYIKEAADKVSKTDKSLSVSEDYNNIVKSGIKQTGPREIIAGDLNKGDKVIIHEDGHPDIVEHKGTDKDGNIILEDGKRETVDFFDKLEIYGKKDALTPEAAAEEYNKANKAKIVFDSEQKSGGKVWYQFTDKDPKNPGHGGTFLVKDLNKIGEAHQKQIDKFTKTAEKVDKNAPVTERLAAAIGNPEAAANAKLTSNNEKQQIQQIVNDSVKQKADLAAQLHKAGHTEIAAKYRADAEENGKKLKAADGVVTEKAVDEALKQTKGTNEKEKQQAGQAEKAAKKTTAKGEKGDIIKENGVVYEIPKSKPSKVRDEAGRGKIPNKGQLSIFTNKDRPANGQKKLLESYPEKIGSFSFDSKTIDDSEQAARLLAPISKRSQEVFSVLVLDKDNHPLVVLQHSTGTPTSNQVAPGQLMGSIHNVKGADHFWIAHNHPSGNVAISAADRALTTRIEKAVSGTGVSLSGHLILTPGGEGLEMSPQGVHVKNFSIDHERKGSEKVRVTERRLRGDKHELLSEDAIQNSQEAQGRVAEYSHGMNGVLFVDPQHRPIRFIPVTMADMKALRRGAKEGVAAKLYKFIDKRNSVAGAFINIKKTSDIESASANMLNFLSQANVNVLDIFAGKNSLATDGRLAGLLTDARTNDLTFYSKAKPGTGITVADAHNEARSFLGKAEQRLVDAGKLQIHKNNLPGEGTEIKSGKQTVGVYHNGTIHLDASKLNPGDAGGILKHEGLHFLLRDDPFFIKKKVKILRDFSMFRGHNDAVTAAYKQVPKDTLPEHIDEEAAAYYLQNADNYKRPLFKRIISATRAFLMRKGIPLSNFTPDDLAALTSQGLRAFKDDMPGSVAVIKGAPILRSVRDPDARSRLELENILKGKAPAIVSDEISAVTDLKKIPKADAAKWESLLSQFDYISHKYKGAPRRIFEAEADRSTRKVELENFIIGKHVEGSGFINQSRVFEKADKVGYKWVKEYLAGTDKSGRFYTIKWNNETKKWDVLDPAKKVLQSLEDENAATNEMMFAEADALNKKGVPQKRIDAVIRFRGATNRGFDLMMNEMRGLIQKYKESGMEPPTVKIADESKRWAAVDNIVNKKKGFASKKEAEEWAKSHKWQDVTITKQADKDILRPISLEEALSKMGDLRGGYFPRIHGQGEFVLHASKGDSNIRKSYDMYAMDTATIDPDTGKPIKSATKKASGFVKKIFNGVTAHLPYIETLEKEARRLKMQGYDVSITRSKAMPESVYNVADLIPSINALLSESIERAKDDKNFNPEQAAVEVNNMLTSKLSELIKERGFLASRLRRSDKYWEGFETDPTKAISQYASRTAGGIAKKEAAMKMVMALAGRDITFKEWKTLHPKGDWTEYQDFVKNRMVDPKTQKNLYKESTSFIREMLRNPDQADRIMSMMKSLAVLKFLAFRVSSAAVNGVNMVQAVPATISAHTGGSLTSAMTAVSKAALEYGRYRLGKSSGLDRKIFNYIRMKNWDEEQFNQEIMKELGSGAGNRMRSLTAMGMYMFGAVEKANRAMTIHAAYNEFLKTAKEINIDPKTGVDSNLMQKALHTSDRAHGVYTKSTAPTWTRGTYNPLKLVYTFQRFQHNYLLNMGEMISADQWKQVAWMLISPAFIAGAGASLATPVMKELAKVFGIGGDDPEEEFYKKFAETFGSDTFARQGISGMLGVNLKGSIQMNNPFPTSMNELLGAPGAIFVDLAKGVHLLRKGQLSKGVEAIIPTGLGSPLKALREYHEGISTGSYSPVYYGDTPLKADLGDAVLRFFSFNPARLSGIREQQWHEREVKMKYQDRRTEINTEWKRFYMLPPYQRTAGKFAELAKMVRSYNDDVIASGRTDLSPITHKSINTMLKRAFRPNKFERSRNN